MKHFKSVLATIAFILAIFLAQAMQTSNDDNARLFGKQIDPITQEVVWVEITNLDEEDYTCFANPEETCISQLVNDDPVMGIEVSGTQQPGNFFLF